MTNPAAFRALLRDASPVEAAAAILGGVLRHGPVSVEILEVEAYGGPEDSAHPDPAAHTWRGPTPRNDVMFGDAGHLYVYLSHGIHHCVNVTCRNIGEGGGVLLRAARVIEGEAEVDLRRPGVRSRDRARGPGNLGRALGISLAEKGTDVLDPGSEVNFTPRDPAAHEPRGEPDVAAGPRVGVSRAADRPWRLWLAGSPEVSTYRRSPRAPATRLS